MKQCKISSVERISFSFMCNKCSFIEFSDLPLFECIAVSVILSFSIIIKVFAHDSSSFKAFFLLKLLTPHNY